MDSPAALCAWIIEKFWSWTEHDGDLGPERFEVIFRRYFGQIHRYLAARVGGRIVDDAALGERQAPDERAGPRYR